jgi:ATP-dependent DNA helicase RecG
MTATPIPRTLTLSIFGDLDISTIDTMPPGRKPVITHLAAESSRNRVYKAVQVEFERGHQAFFVCPRITKSAHETGKDSGENNGRKAYELRDAESLFQDLTEKIFPDRTGGLIHSKLPEDEKKAVMERFRRGDLQYVVATSVVEVGVDIPNATCMVVEHAERFGLSALHQLRGRVGRSGLQAYAFLIFSDSLTEQGKERLRVMRETTDGFVIAEEDLKIRGPGDIAGTQQSGFLRLTYSDLVRDFSILRSTRERAIQLLQEDPGLLQPAHEVLRNVLRKAPPFEEEYLYPEG